MTKYWKIILLPVWFFSAVSLVGVSIAVIQRLNHKPAEQIIVSDTQSAEAYLPINVNGDIQGVTTVVESADARAEIVANFLERHSSPLKPYDYFGQFIVDISDKYEIDYRLLPAIAMQESNICKKIPEGSYNCLGFGIHAKGTLMFDSYEANFERAARELKKNYIDIGLDTPEKIMKKYTPHSNGSWANSVNQWIAEMEYNDRKKGITEKTDADLNQYLK